MINPIIEGISAALSEEFGDAYTIYPENVKQGLREPCFFIQCINASHRIYLGLIEGRKRYRQENQFCIQYFPENKQNARTECLDVAERMDYALETINVTGDLMLGYSMHYEISEEDILSFFVNYNLFLYSTEEEAGAMEELTHDQIVE